MNKTLQKTRRRHNKQESPEKNSQGEISQRTRKKKVTLITFLDHSHFNFQFNKFHLILLKIPGYIHIYDKLRELTKLTESCLKIHTGIIYIFAYVCLQLISRDKDFPPRKSVFISRAISYITAVSYSGILLMINLSHNILSLSTLIERSREE